MALRNYSNTAQPTSLTADVGGGSGSLTISVLSTAGFPPAPFTIGVDRGTAQAEIMLVTSVASGQFTVNRGVDGTPPQAHTSGASVEHVSSAVDFQTANAHINDPSRNDHTQYLRFAAGPSSPDLAAFLPKTLSAVGPGSGGTNVITANVPLVSITFPAVSFARVVEVKSGTYLESISPASMISAIVAFNGSITDIGAARSYAAMLMPITYTSPYTNTIHTRTSQFNVAANQAATFTLLVSGQGPNGHVPAGGATLNAVAYTAV